MEMGKSIGSDLTPTALLMELTSLQALKLICIFTALATCLPLMLHLYHDYLAFVALGPGGTPQTLAGFLKVKALGFLALADAYQPADIPKRFQDSPGHLVDLAPRPGRRPFSRGIAPHRQLTQRATEASYKALESGIYSLGSSNAHLALGTSCFEKHGTGLFSTSPAKRTCQGEVCHAHPSDGSMHMTLHPVDAKKVLETGWGERHPLARGGWFERFVPGGFVMVYAPRNGEEVEVLLRIVQAAVWFISGEDGVTDVNAGLGMKEIAEERRDSGYESGEEVD